MATLISAGNVESNCFYNYNYDYNYNFYFLFFSLLSQKHMLPYVRGKSKVYRTYITVQYMSSCCLNICFVARTYFKSYYLCSVLIDP